MPKQLSDEMKQQVTTHIFSGNKVKAIKAYRDATGQDLKTCKHLVEELSQELRHSSPDSFQSQAPELGVAPLVFVVVASVVAIVYTII